MPVSYATQMADQPNNTKTFCAGDLVRKHPDGPIMIVVETLSRSRLECVWFVNGEVRVDYFATADLTGLQLQPVGVPRENPF